MDMGLIAICLVLLGKQTILQRSVLLKSNNFVTFCTIFKSVQCLEILQDPTCQGMHE